MVEENSQSNLHFRKWNKNTHRKYRSVFISTISRANHSNWRLLQVMLNIWLHMQMSGFSKYMLFSPLILMISKKIFVIINPAQIILRGIMFCTLLVWEEWSFQPLPALLPAAGVLQEIPFTEATLDTYLDIFSHQNMQPPISATESE